MGFFALLKIIPAWVWFAFGLGLVTAYGCYEIYSAGVTNGRAEIQARWDKSTAAYETALAKERNRQAEVVTRTVIEYRDRVQIVKEKGDEIIREVEKLVPVGCDLPGGFRVLHDAAAGAVPLPADPAAAAAAADPVEAPAAAQTIFDNYSSCRADQERLVALQSFVKEISHADSHP